MTLGKKNGERIIIDTSKYGMNLLSPKQDYKFPRGHPCYGCLFVSGNEKAILPPCKSRENCQYELYQQIMRRKKDA
jgi:hypothetical protein